MIVDAEIKWLGLLLAILATDCCTAIYFTGAVSGLPHCAQWQIAIDTILRFYRCGLLESDNACGQLNSPEEWDAYIQRLAAADPFDRNLDNYAVWIEWDFCGTNAVGDIVNRFDLSKDEADWIGFSRHIEGLFLKHNVPWGVSGLVKRELM